jgi:hypothetical protein
MRGRRIVADCGEAKTTGGAGRDARVRLPLVRKRLPAPGQEGQGVGREDGEIVDEARPGDSLLENRSHADE